MNEKKKVKNRINSVLFICTANSGRSPLAEYFFKDLCEKRGKVLKVSSAATNYYNVGIAENSVQLLREDNIDSSGHIPKVITEDMLQDFDLILVMDSSHIEKINDRFPFAGEKTFLLSEYTTGERCDVEDPVGSGLKEYRAVYNEIKGYLNKLVEMI
ncbi:MAG: hypothetical protein KKH98_04355 [Spirochaetes bacterium]|nr:hypothetical protein [Spirochaetota bacterium]